MFFKFLDLITEFIFNSTFGFVTRFPSSGSEHDREARPTECLGEPTTADPRVSGGASSD